MDDILILIGVFVLICIVLMYCYSKREGLSSRPNDKEKEKYAEELYANQKVFRGGFTEVRRRMPWLDPVTYEDARSLLRNGSFTKQNLMAIF